MSTSVTPGRPAPAPPKASPPRPRTRLGGVTRSARAAVGRIPRAGRVCFVLAFVNAAIWGVVVPPFQVPDEIAHFGYAQYLAETGKLPPQRIVPPYSEQEQITLEHLNFFSVIGRTEQRGILTDEEQRALEAAQATHPSPVGLGGQTSITNQPPLYYALEAIPYWLSPSHNILTRLALMRLLSALMAALTVLTVFLFLRELLPGSPWSWTVGALALAFQPTFDFIAAGVHPDNLLFLTSSLTFLILLRAYRRGLTRHRAFALGAVVAAGALTKLTFVALLPGVAVAVLLLAWRARAAGPRRAIGPLAIAVCTAAVPVLLYGLLNVIAWHRGSPAAGGIQGATISSVPGGAVTLHETLDYTWELYLPRLWFMHHNFFGTYPLWTTWFNGLIGRFGWVDYGFPGWVYSDARYVMYGLVAMALVALVRYRRRIWPVAPIFACFALMTLGLLGAIGYAGIRFQLRTGFEFAQARYLLPLAPLYGLFVVLAARGAGRRWAPALGAALVVLAMAHSLFAETLTISRYYG